ncbi:MAG: hypothetical protein DI586_10805, partial [Micavibrio aeruginosavorus]
MFALPDTNSTSSFLNNGAEVWGGFIAVVLILLLLDLFVLNRKDEVVSAKKSLLYAAFYMVLACAFGGWLWRSFGADDGVNYFTAYFIELSLSLDNLFVMSVILAYFNVPKEYQHRVLFWGIMGVLIMRGVMIGLGSVLIQSFDWVLFIFAGFLILTGVKMLFMKDNDEGMEESSLIRFFKKHLRYTDKIDGHKFFITSNHLVSGKPVTFATPLFMALICIEFMDVLFALDSVPAVFAITTEPFVIYTSNIFAILGLRSMYFAITAILERFKYMKYALSIVLVFIGCKVF